MQHIVRLITLITWLTLGCSASASASNVADKACCAAHHRHSCAIAPDDSGKPQAALRADNQLARICCQRPERMVSPQGHEVSPRLTMRHHYLFNLQKSSFCHYRGSRKAVSRRLLAVPACAYYVVMLRHLRC